MPPSQDDFLLGAFMLSLATASFATWYVLLGRMRRGPILVYEPRRPVPWGGAAALLAVSFVVLAILATIFSGEGGRGKSMVEDEPADAVRDIAMNVVEQVVIVGAALAAVVVVSGATKFDLGLPEYVDGFVRDVKIGVVAWLAALLPVYGMQVVLVLLFGQPSQHPLITMVAKDSDGSILVAAFIAAVIAAPICEEIAFRLLLQGWLEKWEDLRLRWRKKEAVVEGEGSVVADGANLEVAPVVDGSQPLPTALSEVDAVEEAPIHGLYGLPHGWTPILISATLFALAHFGLGPDPIPLFLLALVLGYVYQRTHRIVPCIVTHALFNSLTLIALWRMLSTGEPVPP
jgi:membrane protease YdiL (CAAX protease family)